MVVSTLDLYLADLVYAKFEYNWMQLDLIRYI